MAVLKTIQDWMSRTGMGALEFLGKILIAVIVYFIVSKVIGKICDNLKKNMQKFRVEASATSFLISLVRYSALIFTVITIILKLDLVKESSITALLASAGVAISLALQGGLSNLAGGVLILFLKPFKVNDYIIAPSEDVEGSVNKIEMYYTTIVTVDNQMVKIPNSNLTNHTIKNVTAMDRRKLEIMLGIDYESDFMKAKSILFELVDKDSRFYKDEREFFVDDLDGRSVVIGFRAWTDTSEYMQLRWDMLEKIKIRMDEEGIRFSENDLDVHLRN